MKQKIHIIIIAIVAIILVSAVLAITFVAKPNAEKIFLDAIEKQAKTDGYKATYNLAYSVKGGGGSMETNGTMSISKSKNITKTSLSIDMFGEKMRTDQYQTPETSIQCIISFTNQTCTIMNQTMPVQSPKEQVIALKAMLEKKTVILAYAGTKSLVGRNCDEIETTYDMSKQELTTLTESIKSTKMTMCLDKENGIPLSMNVNMEMEASGQTGSVFVKTVITNLEFNIGDIVIPAEG